MNKDALKAKTATPSATGVKIGDTIWVAHQSGEGHWKGRVTCLTGEEARVKVLPAQPGAGSIRKALRAELIPTDLSPAETPAEAIA